MITACWLFGRRQRDYSTEWGGPCLQLKLWWMGTQRVHMVGLLGFSVLTSLVGPVRNIFFPNRTIFHFLFPHRSASRTDRRARSPFSYYVSLVAINALGHRWQQRKHVPFPINSLYAFGILPLLYKPLSSCSPGPSKQILTLTIKTNFSIWKSFSTVSF